MKVYSSLLLAAALRVHWSRLGLVMGVLRKTQSTGLLANSSFNLRAVFCQLQSCRPRCHPSGHSICRQFQVGGQLLQRL
ncbi:hypothetical protein BDR03DRAFT_949138 [Suillus americanus]|nr:hypothetical protein BDR03DRAFT_949138 [Suillus americanus]